MNKSKHARYHLLIRLSLVGLVAFSTGGAIAADVISPVVNPALNQNQRTAHADRKAAAKHLKLTNLKQAQKKSDDWEAANGSQGSHKHNLGGKK